MNFMYSIANITLLKEVVDSLELDMTLYLNVEYVQVSL